MIGLQILLIADEAETARIWRYALLCRGADVSVEEAELFAARSHDHLAADLVVVDLTHMPPDATMHLCALARAAAESPLLLFTTHSDESLLIALYAAGVDDCVCKPVSPLLFLAKVEAWAQHTSRSYTAVADVQHLGGVHLDPLKYTVAVASGPSIHLTKLECRVLLLLMSHCGHVLQAQEIVHRVWGYDAEDSGEILKSIVYRLRRKLEDDPHDPHFIHTMPGHSYMFLPADLATALPTEGSAKSTPT
jgi:two-component system, OmpR family, KDP operon response regulator KdpE